jgi:hypothetical protein
MPAINTIYPFFEIIQAARLLKTTNSQRIPEKNLKSAIRISICISIVYCSIKPFF